MSKDKIIKGNDVRACDVCGKIRPLIVCSSAFGPISFGYCRECLDAGAEPYSAMVSYIALAGRFPDEINKEYQDLVRRNLNYHNISESQFIQDVDKEINDFNDLFGSMKGEPYDEPDL